MLIQIPSLPEGYTTVLEAVAEDGREAISRGMKHLEIVSVEVEVEDPETGMPTGVGRGLNPSIGILEAAQLISGEATPDLMVAAAKSFATYKNGDVFHGSYGPRLRPQIPQVVQRLIDDPGTRQAVVTVWDPLYDLQTRRDIPCTTMMQFLSRDGMLDMLVYMRSNDAWLGFPYDVFQFTQLQCAVAWALKIRPGRYYHHVGSLHLYEQHISQSASVISRPATTDDDWSIDFQWQRSSAVGRWEAIRALMASALEQGPKFHGRDFRLLGETRRVVEEIRG